ncbi:MAG: MBL fold metallo-hydrolase [Chloroflexi bacterium]|nr:MBL fold metallo-hydrolase [Chloroflexota bacterium]
MKIKWLGHASFLITSKEGLKVITDPYSVGGGIEYGRIAEAADIVMVSHDHGDHNNSAAVKGNPEVVNALGHKKVKGIDFRGIASYHDEAKGGQRGTNIIFCFSLDGIKVCHLGDLGHQLGAAQIAEIGAVDVLLVPVGGFFTIDARGAATVCDSLNPKVIIPMHYKTAKCAYPIAGVDAFLKGRKNVRKSEASETELEKDQLPPLMETVVLRHAL